MVAGSSAAVNRKLGREVFCIYDMLEYSLGFIINIDLITHWAPAYVSCLN